MIWKAWLAGHEFDFHDLERLFACGDTVVIKEAENYYLASTEIDNHTQRGETYYEAAQRVLALVNGIARASSSSFRPVALTGIYNEGDKRHVTVSPEGIEARGYVSAAAVVTSADGTQRVELYKVSEIIRGLALCAPWPRPREAQTAS